MTIYKRATNIAFNKIDNSVVVIQLGKERHFHELNESASLLWESLPASREKLIEIFQNTYDAPIEQIHADIENCLQHMIKLSLVEPES